MKQIYKKYGTPFVLTVLFQTTSMANLGPMDPSAIHIVLTASMEYLTYSGKFFNLS